MRLFRVEFNEGGQFEVKAERMEFSCHHGAIIFLSGSGESIRMVATFRLESLACIYDVADARPIPFEFPAEVEAEYGD